MANERSTLLDSYQSFWKDKDLSNIDTDDLNGDIIDSKANLAATEKNLDHVYELVQTNSDPICSSSGCDQYKHPDPKEEKWDMNYPVPHFGMDRDIQGGLINLKAAEGIVGHQWKGIDIDKYANPAKKTDYNFAPALDGDIIDSKANLAATEKLLEHTYSL